MVQTPAPGLVVAIAYRTATLHARTIFEAAILHALVPASVLDLREPGRSDSDIHLPPEHQDHGEAHGWQLIGAPSYAGSFLVVRCSAIQSQPASQ